MRTGDATNLIGVSILKRHEQWCRSNPCGYQDDGVDLVLWSALAGIPVSPTFDSWQIKFGHDTRSCLRIGFCRIPNKAGVTEWRTAQWEDTEHFTGVEQLVACKAHAITETLTK